MAKKLVPSGCPDPMTLAELAKGERINWSKKKDTFDTVAECFGITKEGFMENALQIMNPRISIDKNGNRKIISEKDAEKKIDSLLKAHARPSAAKKEAASKSAKKAPSAAEQRKKIVDVLMRREVSAKEKKEIVKSGELFGVGSNDEVYIASGMKWADKGYFFNETVDWKDICQGAIGDCYFLASLCSIAYVNPFLIKNTTALRGKWNNGSGGTDNFAPWHAIDFYVPADGYESTQAWSDKRKTVQTIVASEEILVSNNANEYNYGVCGPKEKDVRINGGTAPKTKVDRDSCWPAIYEKAYSKFLEKCTSDYPNMGSNAIIHGGFPSSALKELLHTEQVTTKTLASMTEDQIYSAALAGRNTPTTATIYAYSKVQNGKTIYYSKAGTESYYLGLGLYISHVYSLLDAFTRDNKKYVVLRNPHGYNPTALKNNPKVYHNSWGFNYGYNVMDTYRGTYDIYTGISGNDNPYKSNGVFLLEVGEFKRLFCDIDYYSGPSISVGSTSLQSEAPVKTINVSNLNTSASVKVKLEYTNPTTGAISTWNYGTLATLRQISFNLSSRGIADHTKVRVMIIAGSTTYYSRPVYYHNRGSKTVTFKYSSGRIIEA